MDINTARIILTKMQGCFKELNIPLINESEMLNIEGFSDAIMFRSWFEKNGNLAELLAFVVPSHGIVQLTMNYNQNIEDFDESTIRNLLSLLNAINNSDSTFYLLFCPEAAKLEFRTAYYLAGNQLGEKQFKSLLGKFFNQGPLYYKYFRRLINYSEDPNVMFYEMQVELNAM